MTTNVENSTADATQDVAALQTVAISGPNGLVGKALSSRLEGEGRTVMGISRGADSSWANSMHWDPESGLTNPNA